MTVGVFFRQKTGCEICVCVVGWERCMCDSTCGSESGGVSVLLGRGLGESNVPVCLELGGSNLPETVERARDRL